MKFVTLLAAAVVFHSTIAGAATQVSLEEVTKKVSNENFQVLAKAKRVYQAKESIQEARARMIPGLNFWKIVRVLTDPTSVVDTITDIAPFLVPANWFRIEQRELLYGADHMGYRVLWANELMTARALYYKVLQDQELLTVIQKSRADFEEINEIVKARVATGDEKPEAGREIEFQIIGLKEDEVQMKLLIQSSLASISQSLGYPAKTVISLKPVSIPGISSLKKIKPEAYYDKSVEVSPEVAQITQILKVLPSIEKEYNYSFFGGSSISRGVSGGIFDHLPSADSLSLANAPAKRIVGAEASILRTERTAISETIKRQVKLAAESYNSSVEFYPKYQSRLELASTNIEDTKLRVLLGEKLDLLTFLQFIQSRNTALSSLVSARYRIMTAKDKVDRLLFANVYSKRP